jgi:1,4-dihydroxy-2-naphthoate octaprenyltransferase
MMVQFWMRSLRFPFLVACTLTFALGTGIADYLGHPPTGWKILIGVLIVWFILVGGQILFEYFNRLNAGASPFSLKKENADIEMPPPQTLLMVAIVLMTLSVAFGFGLIRNTATVGLAVVLLVGMLLSSVFFIGQPRLAYSGYGELVQGLICCCLVPAFAFSIQAGEINALFLPVTFPLVLIFLAVNLALELDSYAADLKHERRSLLLRVGWQRAVILQHILMLLGFIFLAAAPLFGVAWRLVWPATLALAVAVLEIWLVNRIALGLPPRWMLLKYTAWLAFLLPVYLLAVTFWMS